MGRVREHPPTHVHCHPKHSPAGLGILGVGHGHTSLTPPPPPPPPRPAIPRGPCSEGRPQAPGQAVVWAETPGSSCDLHRQLSGKTGSVHSFTHPSGIYGWAAARKALWEHEVLPPAAQSPARTVTSLTQLLVTVLPDATGHRQLPSTRHGARPN